MNKPSFLARLRNLFGDAPSQSPETEAAPVGIKKALAIIVYDNAQQVVQLKNMLSLHTQQRGLDFDIGVFQDGFDESRPEGVEAYNQTAAESLKLVDQRRFIRQDKHFGELAHHNAVEKFLFEELAYDVVLVLDQIDIASGFFESLSSIAEQLANHPKVAGFTVSAQPLAKAISAADIKQPIAYNRDAWIKTRGIVSAYTRLFSRPMEAYQREVLVTWWFKLLGFNSVSPSQISKRAVLQATHAALGLAEISVASVDAITHLMDAELVQLSDETLKHYVTNTNDFDRAKFAERVAIGDVHVNPEALVPVDKTSVFDLFAAYKFFLKRAPENFAVVESRVGAPTEALFKDFLMSGEFLSHEVYWPAIVEAAKKVIELSKAKEQAAKPVAKPVEEGTAQATLQPTAPQESALETKPSETKPAES